MERGKQDSGLECVTLLLRCHRIAFDPGQISHQFAGHPIGMAQMLRCAKDLKLKARATFSDWFSLSWLPLPAIVELENDRFIIVASVTEQEALVQDPAGVDVTGSQSKGDVYSMESGTNLGEFSYKDGTLNVLIAGNDGRTILYSGLSKDNTPAIGTQVDAGKRVPPRNLRAHPTKPCPTAPASRSIA